MSNTTKDRILTTGLGVISLAIVFFTLVYKLVWRG